ncbi:MAG: O-antigen ligase family protein [Chloroflexi bacterium]|nr:O-antigen ligase family protein [Chloroflexota bacterium]
MSVAVFVFLSFLAVYVIYFGLIARPEHTVYAYLLVWILFPHQGQSLLFIGDVRLIPGLPLFTLVESAAAAAVLLTILGKRGQNETEPGLGREGNPLRLLVLAFILTLVIANVSAIALSSTENYPAVFTGSIEFGGRTIEQDRIVSLASIVGALIWLLGAVKYVRSRRQIEIIFLMLLAVGLQLAAELFIVKNLGMLPQVRTWSVATEGRFTGLIAGSHYRAAAFAAGAIYASLYFVFERRIVWLLALVPLFAIVIFQAYERSVLFGLAASAAFFVWMLIPGYLRPIVLAVALLLAWGVWATSPETVQDVGASLGGEVRSYQLDQDTLNSRLGIAIRSIEVLLSAPLGVGAGTVRRYMSSTAPSVLPVPDYSNSAWYYQMLVSGGRVTGSHNAYLEFLVENGFLGIVPLALFIGMLFRLFGASLLMGGGRPHRGGLFYAQLSTYSMLLFLGAHYVFNHNTPDYFIWTMLLFTAFALRRLQMAAPATSPTPAPIGEHRPGCSQNDRLDDASIPVTR